MTFACGGVETDADGVIISAMPILHKFIGQSITNLIRWEPVLEIVRIG